MRMLHDPAVQASMEARLRALRPDASRQWGSMTAGQMLWHVNQFLAASLGQGSLPEQKTPLPRPLFRFFLLYMPWPKSAPTNRGAVAQGEHDFESERTRCLSLVRRFSARPLEGTWPVDPSFGPMSGRFASKLQAKHLDHHLRQFGV